MKSSLNWKVPLTHSKLFMGTFHNHIDYLHPNIEYMAILYFFYNLSCICYYLLHIPPLIPFSTINNILISVKSYNFTLVLFRATCHGNSGAEKKFAWPSSYILRRIFLKFSNTSVNNNVLHRTYKSWYSPNFISKFLRNYFTYV